MYLIGFCTNWWENQITDWLIAGFLIKIYFYYIIIMIII